MSRRSWRFLPWYIRASIVLLSGWFLSSTGQLIAAYLDHHWQLHVGAVIGATAVFAVTLWRPLRYSIADRRTPCAWCTRPRRRHPAPCCYWFNES